MFLMSDFLGGLRGLVCFGLLGFFFLYLMVCWAYGFKIVCVGVDVNNDCLGFKANNHS